MVVVPARRATQAGGIDSLESFPGLLKSFKNTVSVSCTGPLSESNLMYESIECLSTDFRGVTYLMYTTTAFFIKCCGFSPNSSSNSSNKDAVDENYNSVVQQNTQLVSLLQSTVEMQAYLLDKLVSFFTRK
jgi:hypothetical protein